MTTATSDLMTPAQFAERIGMKEDWVRRHVATIPHRRVGRFLRFTEDDLRAFIDSLAEGSEAAIQRTERSATAVRRRA